MVGYKKVKWGIQKMGFMGRWDGVNGLAIVLSPKCIALALILMPYLFLLLMYLPHTYEIHRRQLRRVIRIYDMGCSCF